MEITVRVTKNYGNLAVYPVCEKAKLFSAIANSKTLTPAVLAKIRELGYTIVRANETLEVLP